MVSSTPLEREIHHNKEPNEKMRERKKRNSSVKKKCRERKCKKRNKEREKIKSSSTTFGIS